MKNKFISVILTAAMAVTMCGCGSTGAAGASSAPADTAATTAETASSAAASEQTSEAIADGVLTVGTNAEFPPFEIGRAHV